METLAGYMWPFLLVAILFELATFLFWRRDAYGGGGTSA